MKRNRHKTRNDCVPKQTDRRIEPMSWTIKFTLYIIIIVRAVKRIIARPAIQTRHKPDVEPLSTDTQIGAFI